MIYFPSDLLLALGSLDRQRPDWEGLLASHRLTDLDPLLDVAAFHDALDALLDGVAQYPFQAHPYSNDVSEWLPAGRVLLEDGVAASTLRGLIWALAFGNEVYIRSQRPAFWQGLAGLLNAGGWPLPRIDSGTAAAATPAVAVSVPVLALEGESPADSRREIAVPAGDEGRQLVLAGVAQALPADCLSRVWQLDSHDVWLGQLYRRRHRPGVTLARARAEQGEAGSRARLDAKLRYLVQRAKRTPHYLALPDIQGAYALRELPILDKAALEAQSLPFSRNLCSGAAPSGEVLRSGATSSQPRYIVYSQTDWNNMIREAIPLFYSLGLRRGDRLINTLYGGAMYGGLTTTICEFSRMPLETYSTGQAITLDTLLMLTDCFQANAIIGIPALILPLLREAKAHRPQLRLEKILYGGTPMAEVDKQWLREELGAQIITSVLAANDGAQIGYQCGHLQGSLHHLCDDYNLLEIVDDDGQPLPDGQPGHILITSLQKQEGPLIRYRIGDYGRIVHHDCSCGASGRVLDYIGRSDGLIKVQTNTVLYSELLESLQPFGVSLLQVEIASVAHSESLILRTESPQRADADAMRRHLLECFETLRGDADIHAQLEVIVESLGEGELPRNSVSGKVKPVIDTRV
ncbi:phenylacetate--CoA ligase family protein [Chromobacterium sp. ASV23]|uniref:phenylacetate--CoA ligase family protein n=1 Tax=Chromobacterium sp. ASV23 TaxID=2795110 RepID=UPI0018ED4228|nr:phenylacetate--CoA ligase family protein [Chromobacterium sp. ASV23]